jgi:hypothetical protein
MKRLLVMSSRFFYLQSKFFRSKRIKMIQPTITLNC